MTCTDEDNDNVVAVVSSYSEEGMLEESGKSKWTKTISDYIKAEKWEQEKRDAVRLMKSESDAENQADKGDEHDCHLVGGGGESGCAHPSHEEGRTCGLVNEP